MMLSFLIAGAGGHAVDLVSSLGTTKEITFYDNTLSEDSSLLGFKVVSEISNALRDDVDEVYIATGSPKVRELIFENLENLNLTITNYISDRAQLSPYNLVLGRGLNIMDFCVISGNVSIGDGCLINTRTTIAHDSIVGDFVELGPSVVVSGNAQVGNFVSVGAGATILPNVKIGDYAVIGAGAVVVNDVPRSTTYVGVPARKLK